MLEIWSVADLRRPGRLSGIGRALDLDPDFRPTRLGVNPAPRRRVASVEAEFKAWEGTLSPKANQLWFFKRLEPPRSDCGPLEILGPSFSIRPHHLILDYEADWFTQPDRLDALAALFVRACDAMGAFYGRAALGEIYTQRNELLEKAHWDRFLPQFDRELPDVYWLNFFGPGYVEFWGERLEGLGARSAVTQTGGRVIWASESPFVHDAALSRVTDYPFKRAFYDRLGIDTFMHEGQRQGAPGQYVPSLDVHRRIAA